MALTDEKTLEVELTADEAFMVRNVFFPSNPNKMRKADPRVVDLAKRMIAALEAHIRAS